MKKVKSNHDNAWNSCLSYKVKIWSVAFVRIHNHGNDCDGKWSSEVLRGGRMLHKDNKNQIQLCKRESGELTFSCNRSTASSTALSPPCHNNRSKCFYSRIICSAYFHVSNRYIWGLVHSFFYLIFSSWESRGLCLSLGHLEQGSRRRQVVKTWKRSFAQISKFFSPTNLLNPEYFKC